MMAYRAQKDNVNSRETDTMCHDMAGMTTSVVELSGLTRLESYKS